MELDEWLQTWRIRHYRVVARVIGEHVIGTQGTPVEVLGRLIHRVEYQELWDVRNELTAKSQAEAMTAPRGGDAPAAGARPRQHGQPTRQRDDRRRAAPRLPRAERRAVRARRPQHPSGSTSSPGARGRRAVARAARRTPTRCAPTPSEWSRDPWSGDLVDGEIWGRGALDMKSQVAASAVAVGSLAREGFRPPGTCAAPHRRRGGERELRPLVARRASTRSSSAPTTRSTRVPATAASSVGKVFYLCAVGEKMSAPFRVHVHGRSGHASMPSIADNALVKAARIVEALGRSRAAAGAHPRGAAVPRGGARRGAARRGRAGAGARGCIRSPPSSSSRSSRSRSRRR